VDSVSLPIFESTGPFVGSDRVEAENKVEVRSTSAVVFFLIVVVP